MWIFVVDIPCGRAFPASTPHAARRRRQLLAEQEASSGSQVPEWVASDPVWQVAQAAAAAGLSEGGSTPEGPHDDDSQLALETATLWANYAAAGGSLLGGAASADAAAAQNGGSGSSAGGAGAMGVRSLDLGTAEDESHYEDAPLPDPPAYDGSEGRADAGHRSAVAAANYSASGGSWDESSSARLSGAARSTAGRRRLADSYFRGPAAGTILSWM